MQLPVYIRLRDTRLAWIAFGVAMYAFRSVLAARPDLAEAWYEDNTAYATVAMRFAMTDVTMERASGRIVSGNPQVAEESVEIWTFRRDGAGQPWVLSAVEQA